MSDDIPAPVEPPVLVIVITFGECEIAIPAPAEKVLYSAPVEALVIPNTEFAIPVVPKPVPPLENASVPCQPSVCVDVTDEIVTFVSFANDWDDDVSPLSEVIPLVPAPPV